MVYQKLQEQIRKYCDFNHIFGCIRVTVGGEIKFEQNIGFADIENQLPFTSNSMFTLYSLSKPFCAIGLLKLKDKGLIDLDSHPSRYIPEAQGLDDRVTVRHLLHHVSGLPDFEQNREFAEKYAPGYAKYTREHLKLLTKYPLYFVPGTNTIYENINFILCALIIENVSGQNYPQYMEKEVFIPLGMKHAVVDNETLFIPHRVKGYELLNGKLCEKDKSHNWLLGAGDIVATVDDIYCLNKAIKNQLLLSKETWEAILTPYLPDGYGMGCYIENWHGKRRITHNGGHEGFRTLHIQLPEDDFDIIFLSNSGFGNARLEIAEMIYSAFYGETSADYKPVEMDKGYI